MRGSPSSRKRWLYWEAWNSWEIPARDCASRVERPIISPVNAFFLEACKLPTGSELAPRPLSIRDKKADAKMIATNLGSGSYEMSSDGEGDKVAKRKSAVTAGLAKLAQLQLDEGGRDRVEFPCGQSHDALVGLLLVRAPNVRVILRQQEMAASRGQLAAPSAQQ